MKKEIIYDLRSGKVLRVTNADGSISLLFSMKVARDCINSLGMNGKEPDFQEILLAEMGQLQKYIAKFPDVAWDLMEFSEKPLSILFHPLQNIPDGVQLKENLFFRWVKKGDLHQMIFNLGQPVVHIKSKVHNLEALEALKQSDKVIDLQANEISLDANPKLMRLEPDGGFEFYN
ncbi:hypothetical protein [Aureibacter tunicatorum]|uniref:L-threonylcarbamoyladenylate synthase n=1 Tax=Aureibacter tunicatorum TaxID=866807 RepID=A0AAE4BT45_9BACT|nr:hypothetical protein [Aureibacter tunicatorum]MDR6239473.1 L-threonylcarbamoyladenylate synthase [Aureibacter tunicatorum]BDD04605.1 hypothetical protein AUTU_20880 [Aureibacter tunicatorum]